MEYIDNLFLSHKLAAIAIKKGFDKPCIGVFDSKNELKLKFIKVSERLKAPLYQQIIDWFWEDHQILIRPETNKDELEWIVETSQNIMRFNWKNEAVEYAFKLI